LKRGAQDKCTKINGKTLTQMENLLGGGIPLDELNEYLSGCINGSPSKKDSLLHLANSFWFRDDENRL